MAKGFFITLEGTDGCGKTTQTVAIAKKLTEEGLPVRMLREPGGTGLGEAIRTIFKDRCHTAMCPETELFLINASRSQLVREVIRPALEAGEIVVCDRFIDSTVAYQGYGRLLPLTNVYHCIELAIGATRPDVTFLLEVPTKLASERLSIRPESDRMEAAGSGFFSRVVEGFRAIANTSPLRVVSIDGGLPVPAVTDLVWNEVKRRLNDRKN